MKQLKYYLVAVFIYANSSAVIGQILGNNVVFQNCAVGGNAIILGKKPTCNPIWILEFKDNFNNGVLDTNKWGTVYPWQPSDGLAFYTANNLTFVNSSTNPINSASGVLQLNSKVESMAGYNFTSGMIISKNLFGYGKYEMRCKIPLGRGHWPAFWIFGIDPNTWQEVDFFEFNLGTKIENNKIHMTAHYNPNEQTRNGIEECSNDYKSNIDYSVAFHTYTVIYMPTEIKWYVDNQLIGHLTRFYNILGQPVICDNLLVPQTYLINKAFPKGTPSNIIINSKVYESNATLPNKFEIDYVRYYSQNIQCGGQGVSLSSGQLGCITFNFPEITTYNNYNVSGCSTTFKAGRSIHLKPPYFHAVIGSNFNARIECSGKISNPNDLKYKVITSNDTIQNIFLGNKSKNKKDVYNSTSIYPNPNTGKFTIEMANVSSNSLVEIYDVMGKKIWSTNKVNNKLTIDIAKQPKGIYLVKITTQNKIFTQKIIYQ